MARKNSKRKSYLVRTSHPHSSLRGRSRAIPDVHLAPEFITTGAGLPKFKKLAGKAERKWAKRGSATLVKGSRVQIKADHWTGLGSRFGVVEQLGKYRSFLRMDDGTPIEIDTRAIERRKANGGSRGLTYDVGDRVVRITDGAPGVVTGAWASTDNVMVKWDRGGEDFINVRVLMAAAKRNNRGRR